MPIFLTQQSPTINYLTLWIKEAKIWWNLNSESKVNENIKI